MSGLLTVFAIICYIPLLKAKGFLKNYIVIGSLAFLLFSILALLEAKLRIILQEKNKADKELISQLQENEKLRENIQVQLEKDLEILSEKIEQDKIKTLKSKYDKALAELKLSSLRSQMNPHFIFNSLNSIKLYIINNEQKNAVYYLNKFSKLIRKILDTTRKKEIPLAEELETTELNISIKNIRFGNHLLKMRYGTDSHPRKGK